MTALTRRQFLATVLAGATGAAAGLRFPLPPVPEIPAARLALVDGYLIDPAFDYVISDLPTRREHLGLTGATDSELKCALQQEFWQIETLVDDESDWEVAEVTWWLDERIDPEELGPRSASRYTEYGAGVALYQALPTQICEELGICLVEGDCPGSSFTGVAFSGDVAALNHQLTQLGLNLVVEG